MKAITVQSYDSATKFGRLASATVKGIRRSGYLVGNRFIFTDPKKTRQYECIPGEFQSVKIWRH